MRRRVFLTCLAGALALGCLGAPAASAAPSPITPPNRPTAIPGQVNGQVASSELVQVGNDCKTARPAGPSLYRLFALARQSNVALDAEQCYRPLNQQVDFARQANQPGANPACVASVGTSSSGAPVGRSYHGWGKAADLTQGPGDNSLTFASPGFALMRARGASVGWNHPAFAQPGTACPEPWHWEWVGDGGNMGLGTITGDAVALLAGPDDKGYAVVTGLGAVLKKGNFVNRGSMASTPIAWVMTGAATTGDREGYWMLGADGGVFSLGNAKFHGSTALLPLKEPLHTLVPTKSGKGYWLLAWDGGVFSFGDAHFYGSTGALKLVSPVDGMTRTRSGNGYWLVAGDGGIFSYGDAKFFGSMGGRPLAQPITAMARTRTGNGYWLVASDGGVFAFGDAKFYGSLAGQGTSPIVAMTPTRDGKGYWLLRADRTVAAFGNAKNLG